MWAGQASTDIMSPRNLGRPAARPGIILLRGMVRTDASRQRVRLTGGKSLWADCAMQGSPRDHGIVLCVLYWYLVGGWVWSWYLRPLLVWPGVGYDLSVSLACLLACLLRLPIIIVVGGQEAGTIGTWEGIMLLTVYRSRGDRPLHPSIMDGLSSLSRCQKSRSLQIGSSLPSASKPPAIHLSL